MKFQCNLPLPVLVQNYLIFCLENSETFKIEWFSSESKVGSTNCGCNHLGACLYFIKYYTLMPIPIEKAKMTIVLPCPTNPPEDPNR